MQNIVGVSIVMSSTKLEVLPVSWMTSCLHIMERIGQI